MLNARLTPLLPLALLLQGCGSSSDAPSPIGGQAPSGFAYPDTELDWLAGAQAPTQAPLGPLQGSDLVWSIAPDLPAGLVLDAAGALRGTPLASVPDTAFTVRAANDFGASEAQLQLEVHTSFDAALDVFAVHATEGRLSRLRYDTTLGRLRPAGSRATVPAPLAIAVDPLGDLVLVGGVGQPAFGLHRLDDQGRPLALQPLAGLPAVTSLAMAPSGAFAVSADLQTGVVASVRLDADTGAVELLPEMTVAPGVTALAIAPGCDRLAVAVSGQSRVVLLSLDSLSGAIGPELASFPVASPQALAFSLDGAHLFVADAGTHGLLTLASQRLTLEQSHDLGAAPQELALVANGTRLAIGLASPASIVELDLASGTLGAPRALATAPSHLLDLGQLPGLDLAVACPAENRLLRFADTAAEAYSLHTTLPAPAALALRAGPRGFALQSRSLLASIKGLDEVQSFDNAGAPGAYAALSSSFAVGISPSGLVSDPRREHVFALGEISGDLWQLGNGNGLPVGPLLRDLELTPDGDWLLIVGQGGLIALDAGNPVLGSIHAAGDSPSALAIAPAGNLVYTGARGSDTVHGFTLDPESGALAELPWSPLQFELDAEPRGLTVSPDGTLLAVTFGDANRVQVFALDGEAAPQPVATIPALWMPRSITFTPDSRYLVYAEVKADLLVVHDLADPTSPQKITSVATIAGPFDLTLSPDGREVSLAGTESDALQFFELDPATGALFERGTLPLGLDTRPAAVGHDLRWIEATTLP